jgi:hypothetical protein
MQPTIDISPIMINWILGHMSMIVLGLVTLMCLSIDNPNKECIVVPFINNVAFAMYVVLSMKFLMQS